MDVQPWKTLFAGTDCWMDAPRPPVTDHWDLVAPLSISSLYLNSNQTYRGHCTLMFDARHACQLVELTAAEQSAFMADLLVAQTAIMRAVTPDHLNLELLGNVVPHLHWHIIPRYFDDPRWGMPIWTTPLSAMPDTRLEPAARASLLETIRAGLAR